MEINRGFQANPSMLSGHSKIVIENGVINERAGKYHDGFRYGKFNDRDPEPTKKEFAEYVKQFPKELSAVMFKMWDKHPYDDIIWKLIKPVHEKPFKQNEN